MNKNSCPIVSKGVVTKTKEILEEISKKTGKNILGQLQEELSTCPLPNKKGTQRGGDRKQKIKLILYGIIAASAALGVGAAALSLSASFETLVAGKCGYVLNRVLTGIGFGDPLCMAQESFIQNIIKSIKLDPATFAMFIGAITLMKQGASNIDSVLDGLADAVDAGLAATVGGKRRKTRSTKQKKAKKTRKH